MLPMEGERMRQMVLAPVPYLIAVRSLDDLGDEICAELLRTGRRRSQNAAAEPAEGEEYPPCVLIVGGDGECSWHRHGGTPPTYGWPGRTLLDTIAPLCEPLRQAREGQDAAAAVKATAAVLAAAGSCRTGLYAHCRRLLAEGGEAEERGFVGEFLLSAQWEESYRKPQRPQQ